MAKDILRSVLPMRDINRALDILSRLYEHNNSKAKSASTPHEQAYFSQRCVEIAVVRKLLWELI